MAFNKSIRPYDKERNKLWIILVESETKAMMDKINIIGITLVVEV